MTGQDVVAIASSGFMGLATLFLLFTLGRNRPVPVPHLWASIVVIALGAAVQLVGIAYKNDVSIEFTPRPSQFARYLFLTDGIRSSPKLWLGSSPTKCIPDSAAFQPTAADCPVFSQRFSLTNRNDSIHISVDDTMMELGDMINKLQSANTGMANRPSACAVASAQQAVGEDS